MVDPRASRFWRAALQSGLIDADGLEACWEALPAEKRVADQLDRRLARQAIQAGALTLWQAQQLLSGRFSGFQIDRYVLLDMIGQGGMGRVYRAKDTRLNRQVALKLLSPERVKIPRAVTRFQREARVGAQLQHENLVRVYDVGECNGKSYLVMEYIEGKNIGELIAENGTMPPAIAARLARQVALGLHHAQLKGLIHRDVNPCNILVTRDGTAKLTDLGLAIDLADQTQQVTRDGATVGTFDYISPEQARHSHAVDTRSDIYSLGCTLYHMLAGRVPFPAPSLMEKLFAHQAGEPEPLETLAPGVPEGLSDVVRRMMQKRPDDRHPTPLAVAQALEPFADGLGFPAEGDGAGALVRGAGGRRPLVSRTKIAAPPDGPGPATEPSGAPEPEVKADPLPATEVSPAVPPKAMRLKTTEDELLRAVLPLDFSPRPPSWEDEKAKVVPVPGIPWRLDRRWAIGLAGALIVAACVFSLLAAIGGAGGPRTPGPTTPPPTAGPHPPAVDDPPPRPQLIVVEARDGTTAPEADLFVAIQRAIGSQGSVLLHDGAPLRLSVSSTASLPSGRLSIRAAKGAHPVLEVELKGTGSLLSTKSDTSLTLSGVTIRAHYTEKGPEEPPALIQAGGDVTLDHCAFTVSGEIRGTRAVSTEGGTLTANNCWFEGFDRAIDLEAYPGSAATIRQCMMVRTGPESVARGWAVRVRCVENMPVRRERQLLMEHCTVVGHGLLDLVGFSLTSPYQVQIKETAVQADTLLAWTPQPPDLPLSPDVVRWSGYGNQYDVRGKSWVVRSASEDSAMPDAPIDLNSWRKKRMTEENPNYERLRFGINPSVSSLSVRPEDFAITNTNAGPETAGADPGQVGPR